MKNCNLGLVGGRVVFFRRWGGENYSAFASLRVIVNIAVLLVSYQASANPGMTLEHSDSTTIERRYSLKEVQVSAQRAPVTYSQAARIISVIDRSQIEAAPVQSVNELLKYLLGVDIRQRGQFGVQSDVSIRGGTFDQTLILLNGINITDPQTGHFNLDLPVSLESIQRIEVIEGPASRVYGPNAFCGAINIITGTNKENKVTVSATGGEHGYYDLNGVVRLSGKQAENFIAVNRKSSDGYISNTDFGANNFFLQGRYNLLPGKVEYQAGYTDKGFGANSFYSALYPSQYERTKTTFFSLKAETGERLHITPSVYWRRHQDCFELFRDKANAPSWYTSPNYHLTDVFGANMNAWFSSFLGKTAFGSDFRSENILSTGLGELLSKPVDIPGVKEVQYTHGHSRSNTSFFVEQDVFLGNLIVSAGIMANWNSDLHLKWKYYPGVDLSYQLITPVKWYASFNKSLRMPTFTDLYYQGPTNIGNPALLPEEATSYETGFKFEWPIINGHVAFFRREGKNMIDWGKKSVTDEKWQSMNLPDVNSDGLECSAYLNVLRLTNPDFFLQKIGATYSYLTMDKSSGDYISYLVLDNLKHKLSVDVQHKIIGPFTGNWNLLWQDRNGSYLSYDHSVNGEVVPYRPFWTLDAKLNWQLKQGKVFVEASNLFNKTYFDLGSVAQPGRWLRAGVSFDFGI